MEIRSKDSDRQPLKKSKLKKLSVNSTTTLKEAIAKVLVFSQQKLHMEKRIWNVTNLEKERLFMLL